MKITIASLVVLFVVTSCDRGNELKRKYRIVNNTSHVLKIQFYHTKVFQDERQIHGPGVLYEAEVDNSAGMALNPENAFWSDSAVVTFNNSKRQVYYFDKYIAVASPETERNILVDSAYFPVNQELHEFTFAEVDYVNADSIQ